MKKLFVLFLLASCTKSVMTPAPPTQREVKQDTAIAVTPPVVVPVGIDTITVYEAGRSIYVFMTVSDTLGVVTVKAAAPVIGQAIGFVTVQNDDGTPMTYETVISFKPAGVTNTIKVLAGQKYVTGIKLN